jgi:hypothetical protein
MNIHNQKIEDAARTASEKGRLHELMLVEGATRAPIIESVKVAAQKMRG